MSPDRASTSASPIPTTENEAIDSNVDQPSTVTNEEWEAMQTVLNHVYDYRDAEGHDPSKVFHRKVNKRALPDYYDVITEPMALSTVKANINLKTYKSFSEFTRDFALIPHNAQLYNRPEAGAYQDALVIKSVIEAELKKLGDENIISAEAATLPDLGEIPPPSPRAADDEDDEDDDDDDEDDDDADADADDSDDNKRRRRRRGPRSTAAVSKRDSTGKGDDDAKAAEAESRKKRGRPPRVDTPMEARIKAVIKGLRKIRSPGGEMKMSHFERLPDKSLMPEYFVEIKNPMALDLIKRKTKRKKYQSVDHFMKDVEVMLENAKMYNQDESQIYKDAVDLQQEARVLAEQEKKKPDTDFVLEDGRLPLPNGILHNGELWKVGDWVHVQNPNDLTKPIVAQIYRTWQDGEGQKWINTCWYYRPEQTVHRYERHFFEHEVVKTGQYRDHHVDEIVDRCFVMFFTRFNKGRPRGFPPDKDVYVCESRYNEEKFKLNKIKTWASCLPDEVREKDYEMDLFEVPKKMKKVPSPLKHLLAEDAKETDDLPKPTWGVENAPPIIGAVHKRPREANESPPPEPTPSPPPPPPPQPVRQPASLPPAQPNGIFPTDAQGDATMGGTAPPAPMPAATPTPHSHPHPPPSYNQQGPPKLFQQQAASPAPPFPPGYHPPAPPNYPPHTPQSRFAPPPLPPHLAQQYSTPHPPNYGYNQPTGNRGSNPANAYNPPRPVEVYHLGDSANHSIPEEIRQQFHRDEHGRILFFTAPPLDIRPPSGSNGQPLGHSVKYLAEKVRRADEVREKRKRALHEKEEAEEAAKKAKRKEQEELSSKVAELRVRALGILDQQIEEGTLEIWKAVYGDNWREGGKDEMARKKQLQEEEEKKKERIRESQRKRAEEERVSLKSTVFLDDIDAGF